MVDCLGGVVELVDSDGSSNEFFASRRIEGSSEAVEF